jgi:hypothetical protein
MALDRNEGYVFQIGPCQAKSEPSQPASASCRVEPTDYQGWHAQQLSNRWLLNGGQLMQVIFAGILSCSSTPNMITLQPRFVIRDRLTDVATLALGLALTVLRFVLKAPSDWWP